MVLQATSCRVLDAENIFNGYRYRIRVAGSCVPPVVSDAAVLSVNPNPLITANPSNAEICEGSSISLIGGAVGLNINYHWQGFLGGVWTDLSDGVNYSGTGSSTLTILDVPVSFNSNRYRLAVNTACMVVYTSDARITVNPNPLVNITGDGRFPLVCGGNDLVLTGNPSGGSGTYTSHQWTGDILPLNTINEDNTLFNSEINGVYNLTYTVIDSKSCRTSESVIIENDIPNAQFTNDAVPSCGYRLVNFTNTSTRAVSYEWKFGDGSPVETTVDATHGFDNMDPMGAVINYEVQLVAESLKGCRDSSNVFIRIYPKADPAFTVSPDTACHPFIATFETRPGGASYTWDFGDGQQENTGYTTLHEYLNTGNTVQTYTATLRTMSAFGCVATSTREVVVYPSPSARFSVVPMEQTYPDATVEINNLVSPGPWSYLYNFGDGTSSTEENPTHTYAEPGKYVIVQTVNTGFCSDSIRQSINIKPRPPVAGFEIPEPACSPMEIFFNNTSTDANAYKWDFGDGSISTKKNPFYTYFEAGIYAVTLTVSGPGGSDQYKADIEVWTSPAAFFNLAPDSVYVNDKPVKFFNYSSGANNYLWDFGDIDEETGETASINASTEYEPAHIYETLGWKDVMLVAYNIHCSDTLLRENAVWVSPAGRLRFPNVFKPNPNGPIGDSWDPSDPNTVNQMFMPGVIDRVLKYDLYIYNRWGEQVFHSKDVNKGWDGYINGRLSRQGVYIWKVKGKYTNGKNFVEAGDVTLLY